MTGRSCLFAATVVWAVGFLSAAEPVPLAAQLEQDLGVGLLKILEGIADQPKPWIIGLGPAADVSTPADTVVARQRAVLRLVWLMSHVRQDTKSVDAAAVEEAEFYGGKTVSFLLAKKLFADPQQPYLARVTCAVANFAGTAAAITLEGARPDGSKVGAHVIALADAQVLTDVAAAHKLLDPPELPEWIRGLGSADALDRYLAAYALRATAELSRLYAPLREKLAKDAAEPLAKAAQDSEPAVAAMGLLALGAMQAADRAPLLQQRSRDPDVRVRHAALSGLMALPEPAAEPAARAALAERKLETRLLGLRYYQSTRRLPPPETLTACVQDREKAFALAAVQTATLAQKPEDRAAASTALFAALAGELPRDIQQAACRALGTLADAQAVPALCDLFRKTTPELQPELLPAFERLKDARALPVLREVLAGATPALRTRIERVLVRIEAVNKKAVEPDPAPPKP